MTQKETYQVLPAGLVRGGMVSYEADLATGAVAYNASVKAGIGFLTKTMNFSGSYSIPLETLKSANLPKEPGGTITVGPLTLTLADIQGVYSHFMFTAPFHNLKGEAQVLTNAEFISIASGNAAAEVSGRVVPIFLKKVVNSRQKQGFISVLRQVLGL